MTRGAFGAYDVPMDTDNKTDVIHIRVTRAEHERIKAHAGNVDKTVSSYGRARLLNFQLQARVDRHAINELRRLGGLLKHLYKESGGANREESQNTLMAIAHAVARIAQDDREKNT